MIFVELISQISVHSLILCSSFEKCYILQRYTSQTFKFASNGLTSPNRDGH